MGHLKRLLARHVRPCAAELDPDEWRTKRLYVQECDRVFRTHLEQIKIVYVLYAGRSEQNRKSKTFDEGSAVRLKDFIMLLDDGNLLSKNSITGNTRHNLVGKSNRNRPKTVTEFAVRDIRLAFTRSLMTQQDELSSDDHKSLTFVEFLEALARVADMKPMSLQTDVHYQLQKYGESNGDLESK